MDARAVRFGECVAVVATLNGGHALLELATVVAAHLVDGSGVEVDAAAAGGRLGVAIDELVLNDAICCLVVNRTTSGLTLRHRRSAISPRRGSSIPRVDSSRTAGQA